LVVQQLPRLRGARSGAGEVPRELRGDEEGVFAFCRDIADADRRFACAFKPQIAHFAALGAEGALARLIAHLHAKHPASR
jgi:orotidine-5'-phosphate decarboxylase